MSDDVQTPAPDIPAEAPPAGWQELALRELHQQRDALEGEIKELSRRRDQLQQEINSSFAGQSDSIARRVKGFQDYLVGALQELAVAAEQMELVVQPLVVQPSPLDQAVAAQPASSAAGASTPPAAGGRPQEDSVGSSREEIFGEVSFLIRSTMGGLGSFSQALE